MTFKRSLSIVLAVVAALATPQPASAAPASWKLTPTGTTARFRGLAPVSATVAWVAGSAGTILRTVDGGRTWISVGPADAAALQFRDIEAFDARHAVALTIGTGTDSRIYTTADGGHTWTRSFQNEDAAAFYDCLTFLDRRHGLALSDPVGGRFRILATGDGGRTWSVLPDTGMPAAQDGEFAFAASGTCLVSAGGRAYFATGGGATSRVFSSRDLGRTWQVTTTGIPSGPSAGIYGLAFRDSRNGPSSGDSGNGLAVGGDYTAPAAAPAGAAFTRNGRAWTTATTPPGEYRSGVAWAAGPIALAVGPTGSDISWNAGVTWHRFDTGSFDAVACTRLACWASGEQGRVARLSF
ncbi:oxidoreductase [Actinoplanes sp. SE50]|uniref:WD40/YVTN/BNR-like repeat-containing protein n=1 Tax=unclassified Actinoplanes TaxID=2626549 RepID=UPI00023ED6C6|nr:MULTISPECIES: oxidoreductase [unclassified Actinoplanes]AEV87904.1 Ycf48-like protein [Actinoplanes sp. SE50/110]ATO86308.1 oxidoreductase [Actinoplanes sp. SE50]SLM03723.1 putative secreted oxidoreductase [Actinoplanes sp. SE50/110]